MKKNVLLIALSILWVSSLNLYAYTIDGAKAYLVLQTLQTSTKVIGANATTPSVLSADIADLSQRMTFGLVSTGVYTIKNGANNYLTCNSSGEIAYASSLDATTDAQWTIADIGTTGFVSIKSVSLSTSYLTSAAVITGPTAFSGSLLTLTTTTPAGGSSSAFKLIEAVTGTNPGFANLLIDPGFENTVADGAPIGEWINDKAAPLGGGGKSRVRNVYSNTGNNSFMLRFNSTVGGNFGYYNISHKLTGLIPGKTYRFSFRYKVDGNGTTGGVANVPTSDAIANVFAATTVNDVVANAIGGASNYITTVAPTVNITSQTTALNSNNLTFVAPASSCYIVFSKNSQVDTTVFYIYMDDMMLVDFTTGVTTPTESKLNVVVDGNQLIVKSSSSYSVYNLSGSRVFESHQINNDSKITLVAGMYIVKSGTESKKVIVK